MEKCFVYCKVLCKYYLSRTEYREVYPSNSQENRFSVSKRGMVRTWCAKMLLFLGVIYKLSRMLKIQSGQAGWAFLHGSLFFGFVPWKAILIEAGQNQHHPYVYFCLYSGRSCFLSFHFGIFFFQGTLGRDILIWYFDSPRPPTFLVEEKVKNLKTETNLQMVLRSIWQITYWVPWKSHQLDIINVIF